MVTGHCSVPLGSVYALSVNPHQVHTPADRVGHWAHQDSLGSEAPEYAVSRTRSCTSTAKFTSASLAQRHILLPHNVPRLPVVQRHRFNSAAQCTSASRSSAPYTSTSLVAFSSGGGAHDVIPCDDIADLAGIAMCGNGIYSMSVASRH